MPSPGRQVSGIAEPGTVGGGWVRERCGIPSTSQRATTRRPGRRAAQCRPAVTSRAAPGAPRGRAEPGRGDATRVPAVVEVEVARRHQKGTNRRTTRRHRPHAQDHTDRQHDRQERSTPARSHTLYPRSGRRGRVSTLPASLCPQPWPLVVADAWIVGPQAADEVDFDVTHLGSRRRVGLPEDLLPDGEVSPLVPGEVLLDESAVGAARSS
jgi:hypothetical protein